MGSSFAFRHIKLQHALQSVFELEVQEGHLACKRGIELLLELSLVNGPYTLATDAKSALFLNSIPPLASLGL